MMCEQAGVSRASYYRHLVKVVPDEAEMELRVIVQEIVLLHHRRYGYRRVMVELRRRGLIVNHKRVLRIMGEDNLLAIRRRKFILTTNSRHEYHVHLNLATRMTLTGINQLWVADITYIRLKTEFVFLAVVLDRFSRKAIGWALSRQLVAQVAVCAVRMAIANRSPPEGVVHHSDGGVQYACSEYQAVLQERGMIPSMSRPGNPYDNAFCESFMKTLKQEEIHCTAYRDFDDLQAHLVEFIDAYYNKVRLHSALGYQTPEEFEQASAAAGVQNRIPDAATMKYFTPPKQKAEAGTGGPTIPTVSSS
jgi:transposase InsO family protein